MFVVCVLTCLLQSAHAFSSGLPSVRAKSGRLSVSVAASEPKDISLEDPVRTAGILSLWAGLISYAALGAPGHDAASQALDADLLNNIISNPVDLTVPPLFIAVFNAMGIWPAIYASLLWPGARDQKLPAAPFVVASVALGMFAVSPYIALRQYVVDCSSPTGPVGKWFESRWNAALLGAAGIGIGVMAISQISSDPNAAIDAYVNLFRTQLFVHVTSLDFCSLYLLCFGVINEDLQRRPGADSRLKYLALIPFYGPLLYLNLRPPLPET